MIVAGEFTQRQFEPFVPLQIDFGLMQRAAETQQKYYDAFDELAALSPNALTGDVGTKQEYQAMVAKAQEEVENAYMTNTDLRFASRFLKTKAKEIGEEWRPDGKAYEINTNYQQYQAWHADLKKRLTEGKLTAASYQRLIYEAKDFKTFDENGVATRFSGGTRTDAINPDTFIKDRLASVAEQYKNQGWESVADGHGNILYWKKGTAFKSAETIVKTIGDQLINAMTQTGQLQDEAWLANLQAKEGQEYKYSVKTHIDKINTKFQELTKIDPKTTNIDDITKFYQDSIGISYVDAEKFKKDSKYKATVLEEFKENYSLYMENMTKVVTEYDVKTKDPAEFQRLQDNYFMTSYAKELVRPYGEMIAYERDISELKIATDHFALQARNFAFRRAMLEQIERTELSRPPVVGPDIANPAMNDMPDIELTPDGRIKDPLFVSDTPDPLDVSRTAFIGAGGIKIQNDYKSTTEERKKQQRELEGRKRQQINAVLIQMQANGMLPGMSGITDYRQLKKEQALQFKTAYDKYKQSNKQTSSVGVYPAYNEQEAKAMSEHAFLMATGGNASIYRIYNGELVESNVKQAGFTAENKGQFQYSSFLTGTGAYNMGPGVIVTRDDGKGDIRQYFIQDNTLRNQNLLKMFGDISQKTAEKIAKVDFSPALYQGQNGEIAISRPVIRNPYTLQHDVETVVGYVQPSDKGIAYIIRDPQNPQKFLTLATVSDINDFNTPSVQNQILKNAAEANATLDYAGQDMTAFSLISQGSGLTAPMVNMFRDRIVQKQRAFTSDGGSEYAPQIQTNEPFDKEPNKN